MAKEKLSKKELEYERDKYKTWCKLYECYDDIWRESMQEALDSGIISSEQFRTIFDIVIRKDAEVDLKAIIEAV